MGCCSSSAAVEPVHAGGPVSPKQAGDSQPTGSAVEPGQTERIDAGKPVTDVPKTAAAPPGSVPPLGGGAAAEPRSADVATIPIFSEDQSSLPLLDTPVEAESGQFAFAQPPETLERPRLLEPTIAKPVPEEQAPAEQVQQEAAAAPQEDLCLVPLDTTVEEVEVVFREYSAGIAAELARTLDCSWERLVAELALELTADEVPQWYWLCRASAESALESKDRLGLVVFRVVRGASSSYSEICHFSLTGGAWLAALPVALELLRSEFFARLPIGSARMTLWYAEHEDGKFKLDPAIEGVFSKALWRWFRLTNTSDGTRGQVVCLRRMDEETARENGLTRWDPPAPALPMDLQLGSCVFLREGIAGHDENNQVVDQVPASAPAGNALVLAECLKRRALAQRDEGLKEKPQEEAVVVNDLLDPSAGRDSSNFIDDLIGRLRLSGKTPLVQSKDAEDLKSCEAFAHTCLFGEGSSTDEAWLPPLAAWLRTDNPRAQAVCSGTAVRLNWKEHVLDPSRPGVVRVAVHATTQIPQGGVDAADAVLVCYLATDDADTFVVVWSLPEAHGLDGQDALYKHCREVLGGTPDDAPEEAPGVAEVALPCFEILGRSAGRVLECPDPPMAPPFELLRASLAPRPPPQGALRRGVSSEGSKAPPLQFGGPFVLCIWHTRLDKLEVPLFATVIKPMHWCT